MALQYYVYILTNREFGTFYVGVTNNLIRRVYEHRNKLVDGFTKKYNLTRLVYYECHDSVEAAIAREKTIKRWPREFKINAIQAMNPDWKDLYEAIAA